MPFPAGRFPRLLCQPRQLVRVPVTGRLDIQWSTLLSLEQMFLYKASPLGVLLPPYFLMLALSYSLSHLQPSGEMGLERKHSRRLTGDCESCHRILAVQCCLHANVQIVSSMTSRSPPLKKKSSLFVSSKTEKKKKTVASPLEQCAQMLAARHSYKSLLSENKFDLGITSSSVPLKTNKGGISAVLAKSRAHG